MRNHPNPITREAPIYRHRFEHILKVLALAFVLGLPAAAWAQAPPQGREVFGLGYSADPAMPMCGRPAPCRPDAFMASSDRYCPLTARERELLLWLYPRDWAPKGK